jgi:hypothetical protein
LKIGGHSRDSKSDTSSSSSSSDDDSSQNSTRNSSAYRSSASTAHPRVRITQTEYEVPAADIVQVLDLENIKKAYETHARYKSSHVIKDKKFIMWFSSKIHEKMIAMQVELETELKGLNTATILECTDEQTDTMITDLIRPKTYLEYVKNVFRQQHLDILILRQLYII